VRAELAVHRDYPGLEDLRRARALAFTTARPSGQLDGEAMRNLDDLGLPKCSDPATLARAFQSIVREREDRGARRVPHGAKVLDELGLTAEHCSEDFARAFKSVR
jgi:hypothetical protein